MLKEGPYTSHFTAPSTLTAYPHPAITRVVGGYFGPARVVFALLDGSDDGNISWDEFRELEKCPGTSWDGIMGRGMAT